MSSQTSVSNSRIRKLTFVEIAVLVFIGVVLIALIAPPIQWASSGVLRIQVRVHVYNAMTSEPISKAKVGIARFQPKGQGDAPMGNGLFTDDQGNAVMECEFDTGATDKRPVADVHLDRRWIQVQAEGYVEKVVPVREEWQPVKELRASGEIAVSIGLLPKE